MMKDKSIILHFNTIEQESLGEQMQKTQYQH